MQVRRTRTQSVILLGAVFCMLIAVFGEHAKADSLIKIRDRHLDSAAGIFYATSPIDDGAYPNLLRDNVTGLEEQGEILEARGIAAQLVEVLKTTPNVSSNILEDATDTLVRLDKRASKIPTDELKKTSNRYRFTPGRVEVGISYDYEIYTRSETLQEKANSGRELCVSLGNHAQAMKNPVDSDYYEETLRYCRDAVNDFAQLKDYKQLRKTDQLLAILMSLKPAGISSFQFLDEISPVSKLEPIIADTEMTFIRSAIETRIYVYDDQISDPKSRQEMFDAIGRWLELADYIGNKRDGGRALYYRGALYERAGKFNEAANDYVEARRRLSDIGYLAFSPLFAEQLEKNLEFNQPGGPLGAAQRARKQALKKNDNLAAAKAEEALANVYRRLQLRKEHVEALSAMLTHAEAAKSKALTARAQYMVALEGNIPNQPIMHNRDRLMLAAELYRQIGDIKGEAMAFGALLVTGRPSAEDKARAFKLAKETDQSNLIAIFFQMGALDDIRVKSNEAARDKARACSDAYTSIHAFEQAAHCEVLVAEIEKEMNDKAGSCAHLQTARDLFMRQGFLVRAMQQSQKITEQECGI